MRRIGWALLTLLLLVGLGACRHGQSQEEETPAVSVVGDFGARPQVLFDAPLEISELSSQVLIEGDGREVAEGDAVLMRYLAVNADTGEVIDDDYGRDPRELSLTPGDAGPLFADLEGLAEGTRIVREEPGAIDNPTPMVISYDILHTQAWGDPVDPPATGGDDDDLPSVSLEDDGEPTVSIPEDAEPPSDLATVPLIRGTGPQVAPGSSITVQYTSVAWSTGEVLDTTWGESSAPVTIPFTGLLPGWQDGLVDATAGSQIMLVVPPDQAFGTDTVVFVIDVLDTTAQDEDRDEDGEEG